MDIIKMTRELGAAIQKDERYIAVMEAINANDADEKLTELIGKINLIQMSYQAEDQKADRDERKLAVFQSEFDELYGEMMLNASMRQYEAAKHEMDELMTYVVGILSLCVNGGDPETCEPERAEDGCGGACSSCAGC